MVLVSWVMVAVSVSGVVWDAWVMEADFEVVLLAGEMEMVSVAGQIETV